MAYAALLSLSHTLESLDSQYMILDEIQQVASLLEKVNFLLNFLDNSSQKYTETIECLESRIIDAAYEAADIIESLITHRALEASASHTGLSFLTFIHALEKVIEEIDYIKKRLMEIDTGVHLQSKVSALAISSNHAIRGISKSNAVRGIIKSNVVVGFDDDMMEIKERLIGGPSNLETVALVGMGGIGKTTLARKLFEDEYIVYHFHIRPWVTVSQDYNVQEILLCLLQSIEKLTDKMLENSTEELAECLYKKLKGRRYVIVMDDVWDTKVLDDFRRIFPNDKNGSRIMMTTRQEKVACNANSYPHHMPFLSEKQEWGLFCEKVFGKPYCPPQLEKNGKGIVENCGGLPLAIVVISGLLSRSPQTPKFWENVEKNLRSVMISNDESFSKILLLSYNHLPHYLKGCFLYMAIFREDIDIRVSKLVKLWVAEGLIKSANGKSLEDVAEENLLDLVDRNLVLVSKKSSRGKIKECKLHDLLRDLCVSEAKRVKFFYAPKGDPGHVPEGVDVRRFRIHSQDPRLGSKGKVIRRSRIGSQGKYIFSLECKPDVLVRSLLCFRWHRGLCVRFLKCRLLRVLDVESSIMFELPEFVEELVNLLYLGCMGRGDLFQSLVKLRNLQTMIVRGTQYPFMPSEVWEMSKLRHVKLDRIFWPGPPSTEAEKEAHVFVLEHLKTLSMVWNFRCTPRVLKGIPNLRKLGMCYEYTTLGWGYYCLNNLVGLHKLESLTCKILYPSLSFLKYITFPTSLQKLTLAGGNVPWDDMSIIGSMPHLQVLKLKNNAAYGEKWEPTEGDFLQLKFLLLEDIYLVHWGADNIHFPRLQHLVIKSCRYLEEIPSTIGEIPTLQSIKVVSCSDSIVNSAKQILAEQLSFGNDGLQVQISEI